MICSSTCDSGAGFHGPQTHHRLVGPGICNDIPDRTSEELLDRRHGAREVTVGDHQANGWIEAGIRTVEAQIRALKLDLEKKYGVEIDHTSNIVPWIVEYASRLVTRFGIGRDGKTPLKNLRGKVTTTPLCGFGECVQDKPVGITRA